MYTRAKVQADNVRGFHRQWHITFDGNVRLTQFEELAVEGDAIVRCTTWCDTGVVVLNSSG